MYSLPVSNASKIVKAGLELEWADNQFVVHESVSKDATAKWRVSHINGAALVEDMDMEACIRKTQRILRHRGKKSFEKARKLFDKMLELYALGKNDEAHALVKDRREA